MSAEGQLEEICVVCCREISIYAVGPCDHPVCYECSTRMRALCEQNECPICRGYMPFVMFTHEKQLFSSAQNFPLLDKRYNIAFEDEMIQNALKELLKHSCPIGLCGHVFPLFPDLASHVRRQHAMHYCELCVDNLKIFTFERKCYTRRDLATHKRIGDVDNTSHRGHPLCEFCQLRFVDHDERFRHLRREHFFCHFCDADGKSQQFYCDYTYLKDHFRREHYLCEEGDCADENFIGAFRTEIDFKAHVALRHSRNKSKAELKQGRTLGLEFSFAPRSSQNGDASPSRSDSRRRYGNQESYQRKRNMNGYANGDAAHDSENTNQNNRTFNTQCTEDFPLLSGDQEGIIRGYPEGNRYSSSISGDVSQNKVHSNTAWKPSRNPVEDFPALSPASSSKSAKTGSRSIANEGASTSWQQAYQQNTSPNKKNIKSAWTGNRNLAKPSHGEGTSASIRGKSKNQNWGTRKMVDSEEDFPRLDVRERFSSAMAPVEPEIQPEPRWPISVPAQDEEMLAQQIYLKCKPKKEKTSHVETEVGLQHAKKSNEKLKKPQSLSAVYSGLSDHNVIGNDEDHDPLQVAKNKCLSYERPKKEDDDDDNPWRTKHKYIPDHFPPLETPKSKVPPGFSSAVPSIPAPPPPGFSDRLKSNPENTSPSISLKSIAQQLTVDNISSLETNFECKAKASVYSYQPPTDFEKRNNSLIDTIYKLADSDEMSFNEFKLLSGRFRSGKISEFEYHSDCLAILGRERFLQLFSELLCLLPDIEQQQELLAVHNKFLNEESKNRGAVPKHKSSNNMCSIANVSVCPTCRQVLAKSDFPSHLRLHGKDPMI